MPVRIMRETRTKVDGWVGSIRILQDIGKGMLARRLRRMSRRRSGVERSAAPIPEWVLQSISSSCIIIYSDETYENGLGHPQFRSLPSAGSPQRTGERDSHPSNILFDHFSSL